MMMIAMVMIIHWRNINQVPFMSWQCLDDDDDHNNDDDYGHIDDDPDDHDDDPENLRWIMDTWASTVSGEISMKYLFCTIIIIQPPDEVRN